MRERNTVVAVVAGLVVSGGMVYLTKKALSVASPVISLDIIGKWEAPGGKWEEELGETLEEAVVRELCEELGWDTRVVRLLRASVNTYANKVPYLVVFYQCVQVCVVSEGEDVEGMWFPLDALPSNVLPGVKEATNLILGDVW